MTFKEKLSNYWFYYKWHTVIGILVLAFVVTTLAECAKTTEPDFKMAYAGYEYIPTDNFQNDMSNLIGDVNGDGKEYVFCDNVVMPETIRTDEDFQLNQKLMILFIDGSTRLFILDRDFVDAYAELFEDLSDIVSEDKLENAFEYENQKIAVSTLDCPILEKYALARENLYVGILSVAENDIENALKFKTAVEVIKMLTSEN